MNKEKKDFLTELSLRNGIISLACKRLGMSRTTYYSWKKADQEFSDAVDVIMADQCDMVESQLLENIQKGDTTAMIFYLKSKGQNNGYGNMEVSEKLEGEQSQHKPKADSTIMKRIAGVKSSLIRSMKKVGKYTADMNYQVDAAAELIVRRDLLKQEIFDKEHSCVNIETSREGNVRESISPRERLYLEYTTKCQSALRALGMNTDSKNASKGGSDGFDDFMTQFKNDK